MISLTRLSGSKFVLNSDLIERVDATPDSVVTLVDGKKYVVSERPDEIVHLVRAHRAWIIALSAVVPADERDVTTASAYDAPRLAPVSTLPTQRGPRDRQSPRLNSSH